MKLLSILILLAASAVAVSGQTFKCLPADIGPDDIVKTVILPSKTEQEHIQKISVRETLRSMRAKCRKGKLVNRRGREIRFYRLQGCWGNRPANSGEIMEEQRKEIASLRKKYCVIELTCNPSGLPVY